MTEYLIGIGPARPRASCVGVAPFRLACQPWRGVGRNRNAGEKRRARPDVCRLCGRNSECPCNHFLPAASEIGLSEACRAVFER